MAHTRGNMAPGLQRANVELPITQLHQSQDAQGNAQSWSHVHCGIFTTAPQVGAAHMSTTEERVSECHVARHAARMQGKDVCENYRAESATEHYRKCGSLYDVLRSDKFIQAGSRSVVLGGSWGKRTKENNLYHGNYKYSNTQWH